MLVISSETIQSYANFSESSIFKKMTCDAYLSDNITVFNETMQSLSSPALRVITEELSDLQAFSICSDNLIDNVDTFFVSGIP